jgi:hypothetical protein
VYVPVQAISEIMQYFLDTVIPEEDLTTVDIKSISNYTPQVRFFFRHEFTLEDAIGSHACSLEAHMRVTNGIPHGCPLFLPVHTVNCVQTLKAKELLVQALTVIDFVKAKTGRATLPDKFQASCDKSGKGKEREKSGNHHHHSDRQKLEPFEDWIATKDREMQRLVQLTYTKYLDTIREELRVSGADFTSDKGHWTNEWNFVKQLAGAFPLSGSKLVAQFGKLTSQLIEVSHKSLVGIEDRVHHETDEEHSGGLSGVRLQFRLATKRAVAAIKLAKRFRTDTDLSCSVTIGTDPERVIAALKKANYVKITTGIEAASGTSAAELRTMIEVELKNVLAEFGDVDDIRYGEEDEHQGPSVSALLLWKKKKEKHKVAAEKTISKNFNEATNKIRGLKNCYIVFPANLTANLNQCRFKTVLKREMQHTYVQKELYDDKEANEAVINSLNHDQVPFEGMTTFELFQGVRCAFFGRNLHSRMPLDPTPARLKRADV